MRYVFAALLMLVSCCTIAAPAALTLNQQGILGDLLEDDLLTYLGGGNSQFQADWSLVATPWTSDFDIGMRYREGAVAADDFYGDRLIFVRGHFYGAQNWIGDDYRVQMWLVAAIVPKNDSAFLQDATHGSAIELACRAQGQEIEYVYLKQCQSEKMAIAELVTSESKLIVSRRDSKDLKAMQFAIAADRKIASDDPCRATMGGCIDDIKALQQ